jgi:2,3-bisphosphoglycerate-independent phosphoglycerate mutase
MLGMGGIILLTADHGNAEDMLTASGRPVTAHSTNPVPLLGIGLERGLRDGGKLADVAPTILELLELKKPAQMTGKSLLK